MAIANGKVGQVGLARLMLMPSGLSAVIAVTLSVTTIGATLVLTRFGSTVQQSLLGLEGVYQQSSIGTSIRIVSSTFVANPIIGDVLLFLFWGMVGIVVYSIAQSVVHELRDADALIHDLLYVHEQRSSFLRRVGLRALVRVGALAAWWVLTHLAVYELMPYAIAAAHASALHPASIINWGHIFIAGAGLMVAVHGMTVLLRLVTLRVRVFSDEIID